jgi:hypothetical protein
MRSITLREERKLRLFGNRVLKRIYGSKREDETGSWRRLHIGELPLLYFSTNIIRVGISRRVREAG